MTCEHARTELLALTRAHSEACKQLYEFTAEYVRRAEENPFVLVSGYRETVERFEREAMRLAQEHRVALKAYTEDALAHNDEP